MDPMTMLALIQAGVGTAQAGIGLTGMAFNRRPKYTMPNEVNEQVAIARKSASGNMPGYEEARGGIDLNTANAIETAKLGGDPTRAAATIQASANRGSLDLNSQNAAYRNAALASLYSALTTKAQYSDMEWQLNKFAPYAEKQKIFTDLVGGGLKNISGGLGMAALTGDGDMFKKAVKVNQVVDPTKNNKVLTSDGLTVKEAIRDNLSLRQIGMSMAAEMLADGNELDILRYGLMEGTENN